MKDTSTVEPEIGSGRESGTAISVSQQIVEIVAEYRGGEVTAEEIGLAMAGAAT